MKHRRPPRRPRHSPNARFLSFVNLSLAELCPEVFDDDPTLTESLPSKRVAKLREAIHDQGGIWGIEYDA
jgi:hypothetical protein